MIEDLVERLKTEYQNVRVLDDGTIVGTIELIYTRAIVIDLNEYGYEKRFCFEDRERAVEEINKLTTGEDEPTGWIARR